MNGIRRRFMLAAAAIAALPGELKSLLLRANRVIE